MIRWVVRLDAAEWRQKELTVRPVNLRVTDPARSLGSKVVLAMTKLMGTSGTAERESHGRNGGSGIQAAVCVC